MNKKMYFAPETEAIELLQEGFLCASDVLEDGDPIPVGGEDNSDEDGF